ncbi:MAG: DUF1670 domain-containing protein [Thermoplasmata archaeon]|nr:MAG: DUF1670 domain-containing protein [Thermoplasmata archaeon]
MDEGEERVIKQSGNCTRDTINLALEEEILLFLDVHQKYRDEFVVPFAASQRGIADATGVAINNLPRTLKKMIDKGLIEEKLKHVKGASRRLKTYFLTEDKGVAEAQKLSKFINEVQVLLREHDGSIKEIRVSELNRQLRMRLHPYDLLCLLIGNCSSSIISTYKSDNPTTQIHSNDDNGGDEIELLHLSNCLIAPRFKRRNGVWNHDRIGQANVDEKLPPNHHEILKVSAKKRQSETNNNGQMIYHTFEINGNSSRKKRTVAIKLTITSNDDFEILGKYGITAMRRNKIQRLTKEAYEQGGLLTKKDLVSLMCSSPKTIKKDLSNLRNNGYFIPTREHINRFGMELSGIIMDEYPKHHKYIEIKIVN